MAPRTDYDDRQHRVYAAGRALSEESKNAWATAFGRYLEGCTAPAAIDVGSGAGRFSLLLAERCGADVVGVEPSRRMREVAVASSSEPRVRFVEGAAEDLPVPDRSFDAALLSDVLHHIGDRHACVHELARAVRPGGVVFVRGVRPERFHELLNHRYFPAATALAVEDALTSDQVCDLFAPGGFRRVAHEIVDQRTANSLAEFAERTALRAISYLERLPDAEFEAGLAAMRSDATKAPEPQPVVEGIDLLVFTH